MRTEVTFGRPLIKEKEEEEKLESEVDKWKIEECFLSSTNHTDVTSDSNLAQYGGSLCL